MKWLLRLGSIMGVCIIGYVLFLGLYWFRPSYYHIEYCPTFEEVIENSNQGVLDYWEKQDEGRDTLISPLAVQSSLYEIYSSQGEQNIGLFENWSNGFRSYQDSGRFDTIFRTERADSHYITSMLGNNLEGNYAVFDMELDLEGGYYDGRYLYCIGTYKPWGISVPLKNGYELCLDYRGTDTEHKVDVILPPFEDKFTGDVLGLKQLFNSPEIPIQFFGRLALSPEGYKTGTQITDGVLFDSGFTYCIRNTQTGLIVAIGRR